jgi:hypothetical protein
LGVAQGEVQRCWCLIVVILLRLLVFGFDVFEIL